VTPPAAFDVRHLGDWLATSGLRIAIIALACLVGVRLAWGIIARVERAVAAHARGAHDDEHHAKRARTIGRALRGAVGGAIVFLGVALGLREVRVDIGPILAGAGVAGLAIGFGAQTLVRDVIAGLFILSEDQFAVGDVIAGAGVAGAVEDMNLRTTSLRDQNGDLHVIPNGEFKVITNMSREFHAVLLDVGIAYSEEVDRVLNVLRREVTALANDPAVAPLLHAPVDVQGVEAFHDLDYVVRVNARCEPRAQREVRRAVATAVLRAFQREGIRMRTPPGATV
jgi:small conductance mechanosensitive channel